jgi:Acetoacetate decarboxylase (ADC)
LFGRAGDAPPMTDPLQYLRDLQVTAVPRAPTPPRAAPAPITAASGFVDPADLPALALSILAEGRSAKPAAGRLCLQRRTLPDGGKFSLPIRYFDARCLIAEFSLERSRVNEALRGTGLRATTGGETASVLYGCFEYRDSDLGPYNEIGLSIPALAPGDAEPALYVMHLPVTTAETDRIGRALWGYPKFVAGINIHGDGRAFSSALRDPAGLLIAKLDGVFAALKSSPPTDLPTYSHLNGQLLRTRIEALTPFEEGGGAGFVLKVGPSDHPMAQALRALGLDGARPVGVRRADPFQAMLFPGFPE